MTTSEDTSHSPAQDFVLGLRSEKRRLRALLQDARRQRTDHERERANQAITNNIISFIDHVGARKISAYCPLPEEPGGSDLPHALSTIVDELWLPLSRPKGVLEWARYDGPNSLSEGAFGIVEPHSPSFSSEILGGLDLLLIPALGADVSGHRIGKGAGYYDRALAPLGHDRPIQVLLLFEGEIRSDIPFESHDTRASHVINEREVLTFPVTSLT